MANSPTEYEYDVFLSFRGETREGYTAHLREALKKAGIKAFYDRDDGEVGKPLKDELKTGIKTSRASVVVLSKDYASSTWCLEELRLLLNQRKTTNHIVIAVFYHVNPTDLRLIKDENHPKSSFKLSMQAHEKRMNKEKDKEKKEEWRKKIPLWKDALAEVPGLIGKDVTNYRDEVDLNEEIIADILGQLSILIGKGLNVLEGYPKEVGIISSWLTDAYASTNTADILTIYGMDGIGKTRLAQYVYLKHCTLFQRNRFITDFNENEHHLQKEVFSLISKLCSVPEKEDGESGNASMIKKKWEDNKVLLVIDNVDGGVSQLNDLIGNRCFPPGSKIIFTTRNVSLTKNCARLKTPVRLSECLLNGLDDTASYNLLCLHAFPLNEPPIGFEELCKKLVKYCQGHPMALEILGKHLSGEERGYWNEYINLWENKEIYKPLLKIVGKSIESLGSKNAMDLFKHIAFFFAGKDRVFAETILAKCDISIKAGMRDLTKRCLVTIGPTNELIMHQLLQVIGRHEVDKESPDVPSKRSRLWRYTDSYNVLRIKTDKDNLTGMLFDRNVFEKKNKHVAKKYYLSKMNNLKLLQLNYVEHNWSYKNFPEELRWLCMHGFPEKSIPIDLPMQNLVALDLSRSKIDVFYTPDNNKQQQHHKKPQLTEADLRDRPLLPSLKILNLSVCEQLTSICGFPKLPALERLTLTDCSRLTEICGTIKDCDRIVFIDISYCYKLKDHKSLCRLRNLKELSLIDLERPTVEEISRMRPRMPKLRIIDREDRG